LCAALGVEDRDGPHGPVMVVSFGDLFEAVSVVSVDGPDM
jgi:hypothetical protein